MYLALMAQHRRYIPHIFVVQEDLEHVNME